MHEPFPPCISPLNTLNNSPLLWVNQPPSLSIFLAVGITLLLLKSENTFYILHCLAIATFISTLCIIKLGILVGMLQI
jgi:hypothetical protein